MRHQTMHLILISAFVSMGMSACTGPGTGTEADVDPDANNPDTGGIKCPDGLVAWPEHGLCAPHVEECEPWEVPVAGGACVAVGPRACPKLWEPDTVVDCELGELMPCREGFVETENGIACVPHFDECEDWEVPVLGGGCNKVGPAWISQGEDFTESAFDECPPGRLALRGGGCFQVGPRACPKLWNPDTEEICEVGDLKPCPENWIERTDGMYCDPGYDDDCAVGERPIAGGGCVRMTQLPEACPPGPFPEIPTGITDSRYVLADSTCTENCGTAESPYPSIQMAIDDATPGAAVLVGPGTYPEGLTPTKSIHIVGLCAALVEVTGKAIVAPGSDSKILEAGIGIHDVQGVTVSGLRVQSPANGVAIIGDSTTTLEALEIAAAQGVALYVDGGSDVSAEGLWIHDTGSGSGELGHGRGVWVGGEATLIANLLLIEDTKNIGLEVEGPGTKLDLTDGIIRRTKTNDNGKRGWGMRIHKGATATVSGSLLEENGQLGLSVQEAGTEVELSESVIRRTLSDENGASGVGIEANAGCKLSISSSLLEENRQAGLSVFAPGTEVYMSASVIRETLPAGSGFYGWAIQASLGGSVSLTGSLLEKNTYVGLTAGDSGTKAEMSGCVVRQTLSDTTGVLGRGVHATEGCEIDVSHCLLEENREIGIAIFGPDTKVDIAESVVRKTMPNAKGERVGGIMASGGCVVSLSNSLLEENSGIALITELSGTIVDVSNSELRKSMPGESSEGHGKGISAELGSRVSLKNSVIAENRTAGLVALDPETEVEISGSIIRKTTPDELGEGGWGLLAANGAGVWIDDSLLEENSHIGLVAKDPGTRVEVIDCVIRQTLPSPDGTSGMGIQASDECKLMVAGSLMDENRRVGLIASHPGTVVDVRDSVIRGTLPGLDGSHGRGIEANTEVIMSVTGCLVEENREVGLNVYGDDTDVQVSDSVIRKTLQGPIGNSGPGIQAGEGCRLSVTDSLLEENQNVGLIMGHPGTLVDVSGSVVRRTLPGKDGSIGRGLEAQAGAKLSMTGCLVEDNAEDGLAILGLDTGLDITGSVIRGTQPNEDGMNGRGLVLADGAIGEASWCRIDENSTAGVSIFGLASTPIATDPTLLHMVNTAVLMTKKSGMKFSDGGFQVGGDGVFAGRGANLKLDSVVVMHNERAGAYYHESPGNLSDTIIVGNGSYGLAMDNCQPKVADSDTFIFGNDLASVTSSPEGLPTPPVPVPSVLVPSY